MQLRWIVCAVLAAACGRERGEPHGLAADRAAGAVLVLDREQLVLERIPLAAPRLLAATAQGAWVAGGDVSDGSAPRRLWALGPDGANVAFDSGGLTALCADGDGDALVLERTSSDATHLWRVRRDLGRTLLGAFPPARALATWGRLVLVGT
jgi:hypothetical protein